MVSLEWLSVCFHADCYKLWDVVSHNAEAWPQVNAEFARALALRSQIRHAGWSDD